MASLLPPLAAGFGTGIAIAAEMRRAGMSRDRGALAVLLVAIASYYAVFAAAEGDWLAMALHLLPFGLFLLLALFGYRRGAGLIALGIVAHGVLDLALGHAAPGPAWWPACRAALDVTVGTWLLLHLRGSAP